MALETAPYINSLDAANPTALDLKSQGDDHIRLLKSAIKATFPALTAPVTKTAAQLNTDYGPANVLGTTTQTLGAPTGAVIERGSNANGDYVRFADGTQICTLAPFADIAVANTPYNDVRTYPMPFAAIPLVIPAINAVGATYAFYATVAANAVGASSATISRRYDVSQSYTIGVMVIGRWF